MAFYIALLAFAILGIIFVVILLFNEQKTGKTRVQTIIEQNKTTIEQLKNDSERVIQKNEELTKANEQLTKTLQIKNEEIFRAHHQETLKIAELIDKTKLSEIMTTNVISIRYSEPFSHVAQKMKEYHVRHLPVVNDEKKVVGIITQRMLYKIQSHRKLMDGEWYYDEEMLNDVILEHVMEKDVYCLHPDQSMGKALMKMTYSKFGGIPIVDNDQKLVGIVTRKDILKVATRIYESKHEKK